MTAEERDRMNALCARIQEEKDYKHFESLLRELTEVIHQKELRFPQHEGALTWHRNRPWKSLSGRVQRVVKGLYRDHTEHVEITIPEAENLFREIRIENTFTDLDGQPVALKQGTPVDVTFEADVSCG